MRLLNSSSHYATYERRDLAQFGRTDPTSYVIRHRDATSDVRRWANANGYSANEQRNSGTGFARARACTSVHEPARACTSLHERRISGTHKRTRRVSATQTARRLRTSRPRDRVFSYKIVSIFFSNAYVGPIRALRAARHLSPMACACVKLRYLNIAPSSHSLSLSLSLPLCFSFSRKRAAQGVESRRVYSGMCRMRHI